MNNLLARLCATIAVLLSVGLFFTSAFAQLPSHLRDYPLGEQKASGDIIAPIFNGWVKNEDGSVRLVFGFANRNREEIVDIPIGSNNFIEPSQFNGVQPTHFPIYKRRGFIGINERGAFAVTVPAEMAGTEVVWTLKHAGHEYSVPGRATSPTYELSDGGAAFGSLLPAIRFKMDGVESTNHEGIMAERIITSVGTPINLAAYVQDRSNRAAYPDNNEFTYYQVGTEWVFHQGPATPDFSMALIAGDERLEKNGSEVAAEDWTQAQTEATFREPGEYMIRLRVDNFLAPDSRFDYMCCWSNAFVPITVTP
tara:strand:+ start:359 stop:1288 length:930 start_codon:yes stop_codon:yes gene_type:complete